MKPPGKRSPSATGSLSQFAVATALTRAGHSVFTPLFSPHNRTDLIYASLAGIRRVQCKTAHLVDGFVSFWTCSNTSGVRKAYEKDVDEFGVYCLENDRVYLVPVLGLPARQARLRVDMPKSNQVVGIRWARDFELGTK